MTKWMSIALSISEGEKNIPSPWHKDGIIESVYVRFDRNNNIGYLMFWCSVTYRGVIFSRLEVPENVDYVFSGELGKLDLPDIKLEHVNF